MYFTLNDIPVQDPQKLLSTSEMNGFSTDLWYGKANSWVDRRGIDPSYGYFIVDYSIIEQAKLANSTDPSPGDNDDFSMSANIYKLTLKVYLDERDSSGNRLVREYQTYPTEWVNVTPDWTGEKAIYLIKVEDCRFIFRYPESAWLDGDFQIWFNKVETYLSPSELQAEFDLETEPSFGKFVYASYSTKKTPGGDPELDSIGLPVPYTWEELLVEAFKLFTVKFPDKAEVSFPWFEHYFDFDLDTSEIEFNGATPQNITTRYKSGRDFLAQLLYWTNTTLLNLGDGKIKLIRIESDDELANLDAEIEPYQSLITDIKFTDITSASMCPPGGLGWEFPLLPQERLNNEEKEYETKTIKFVGDGADIIFEKESALFPSILMPYVWTLLRDTTESTFQTHERFSEIYDYHIDQLKLLFEQYPARTITLSGGRDLPLSGHLERISFYDLGDGPFTQIDSILEIDWSFLLPKPIIPRETKLSVILAKADGTVTYTDDQVVFNFKDAKLITGEFPAEGKGTAYNTFKRNYTADEEMILIKGVRDDWRVNSQISGFDGYYTIDPGEYLVLKFLKSDLIGGDSGNSVLLSDCVTVNGRSIFSPGETTTITFERTPTVIFDEGDSEWIYIRFDFTVGDETIGRWTVADAGNFRPLLKGIGGYSKDPIPTGDYEEAQIVTHPALTLSGDAKLAWERLAVALTYIPGWGLHENPIIGAGAGRTAAWIDGGDLGGGGGPGGGTGPPGSSQVTICKALVNEPVDTSGAVVDFDGAVAIIGTAPTGGTGFAQNTFNLPFVDNEEVLLVQRNDASWTMLKATINILRGYVDETSDVARTDTEFDFKNPTALYGKAPTAAIQMKAVNPLGHEFANNDELLLIQIIDGKFFPISIEPQSSLFRTISTVGAASWNNTTSELTVGAGTGRKLRLKNGSTTVYEVITTTSYTLKNMAPVAISNNKVVQAKRIGKFWFVDVEPC